MTFILNLKTVVQIKSCVYNFPVPFKQRRAHSVQLDTWTTLGWTLLFARAPQRKELSDLDVFEGYQRGRVYSKIKGVWTARREQF